MHNILYRTFSRDIPEVEIVKKVRKIVQSNGDRYGTDDVKFVSHRICDNEERAREYIGAIDGGWYGGFAVKFYDFSKVKNTKKIDELEEKIKDTVVKKKDFINAHHVKGFKASYIGCSKCGSKISKEYLQGDCCPVCRTDLRAASVLERIESFDKRIEEYKAKIEQEKKKQKDKAEIKWLVKFEYHS
jgi:DNA repair exonuclease SbcCD ATPase subunit